MISINEPSLLDGLTYTALPIWVAVGATQFALDSPGFAWWMIPLWIGVIALVPFLVDRMVGYRYRQRGSETIRCLLIVLTASTIAQWLLFPVSMIATWSLYGAVVGWSLLITVVLRVIVVVLDMIGLWP